MKKNMYYMLKCELLENKNGEALGNIHNYHKVGKVWLWSDGKPLEPEERASIPNPITMEYEPFRGYEGPPEELYTGTVPVMTKRLADAIVKAGVRNIELFPVVLKNTVTGKIYDYRAFHLIGLVSVADLSKSKWISYDNNPVIDTSIYNLVFDESKAQASELLMFYMEENISAIVVHKKVRDCILSSGIKTLKFVKPEDWVHL